MPRIPEAEIEVLPPVRSSGAGGQKVNKTSSKVQVRWRVDASAAFTDEEKVLMKTRLAGQVSQDGYVFASSQQERKQSQNKALAIERLQELVASALHRDAPRVPTKPKRSATEQRLGEKSLHGRKKEQRRYRPEE